MAAEKSITRGLARSRVVIGRAGAASTGGEEGLLPVFPITNPIDRAKALGGRRQASLQERAPRTSKKDNRLQKTGGCQCQT